MEESPRIWGILFPSSECSYKKQSCDHCRAFSRPNLVFPAYRSYMDLIQAILTKLVHFFVCGLSYIDLKLFLSVRFMTIHLDHKHELSLHGFFIQSHYYSPASCSSMTFCKRPLPPTILPACAQTGPLVPVRLVNDLSEVSKGMNQGHLQKSYGYSNLLLDGDK